MEVNAQARPSRETIDCKAQRSRFVEERNRLPDVVVEL